MFCFVSGCIFIYIWFFPFSFSLFLSSPFFFLLIWCAINVNFHVYARTCYLFPYRTGSVHWRCLPKLVTCQQQSCFSGMGPWLISATKYVCISVIICIATCVHVHVYAYTNYINMIQYESKKSFRFAAMKRNGPSVPFLLVHRSVLTRPPFRSYSSAVPFLLVRRSVLTCPPLRIPFLLVRDLPFLPFRHFI